MPNFTWGLDVGSFLLALFGIAGGFASFYFGTKNSLTSFGKTLENGMLRLDKNIETMNKVMTDLAVSTVRQDNFEKYTREEFSRLKDDIKDIKHGRGLITPPERIL